MPRFQMCRKKEYEAGVGMIRAGSIPAGPKCISETGAGGANVRVRVVAVDAPSAENAFHVSLMAGPAHVVHDLVVTLFLKCPADP